MCDAQLNPDDKQITFYGAEAVRFIIHEWNHAAFPSFDCDRHAEGLAFYVQHAATTQSLQFFGWESTRSFIYAYLSAQNREFVDNWFDFLSCGSNFYDSRWGRLLIARALSAEFVTHLINTIGLEQYLVRYYKVIRRNCQQEEFEFQAFCDFIQSQFDDIPTSSVLRDFFAVKALIVQQLSQFALPERGSVLRHLKNASNKIGPNDVERIRELALADLRITLFSTNQEKWGISID